MQIAKDGAPLYSGDYEIKNAESFGEACSDAWQQLQRAQLSRETSIGALMEHLNESVLNQLNGASITVTYA